MVNAAAADMVLHVGCFYMDDVQDRVAATRLRELGLSEEKIVAHFGYAPEPVGAASKTVRTTGS